MPKEPQSVDGIPNLIEIRPRADTLYISQGRVVLATQPDGMLTPQPEHGLLVYKTRMLSCYRYLVDGKPFLSMVSSNVEQHSWIGYYIMPAPGVDIGPVDQATGQLKPASQHTLEMILRRFVGPGIHEDVDLSNYTQEQIAFTLQLEIEADFADQNETAIPEKK